MVITPHHVLGSQPLLLRNNKFSLLHGLAPAPSLSSAHRLIPPPPLWVLQPEHLQNHAAGKTGLPLVQGACACADCSRFSKERRPRDLEEDRGESQTGVPNDVVTVCSKKLRPDGCELHVWPRKNKQEGDQMRVQVRTRD